MGTTVLGRLSAGVFALVHGHNLIYNTCWEDPARDREALDFGPDDCVLVITSAGCNALDYLLAGAGEVHAVDLNPRQNALLELKAAAIRALDHDAFFELFGLGRSLRAREMYRDALRGQLSPAARTYWDRHLNFFEGRGLRSSFYYHGTNGLFAWLLLVYARLWRRLGSAIDDLLAARGVEEQRAIYEARIRDRFWTASLNWFLARHTPFLLLGVPWPQRREILTQYPGGTARFSRDCLEAVLTEMPLADNYFWRVYLQGQYTRDCCPEYLRRENFLRLKAGLLNRLHVHTGSVTEFLRGSPRTFSKFVLLDHMDWMSWCHPRALAEEWSAILGRARPGARVIFRSAGLKVSYLDGLRVQHRGREVPLGGLLRYDPRAAQLHRRDRTRIYGSFYIADLPGR